MIKLNFSEDAKKGQPIFGFHTIGLQTWVWVVRPYQSHFLVYTFRDATKFILSKKIEDLSQVPGAIRDMVDEIKVNSPDLRDTREVFNP